jgi:Family of unknown function (DUF6152)
VARQGELGLDFNMKKAALFGLACAAFFTMSAPSSAHHSFAVWDLQQSIPFEGVIDTVNFRNPHMSMTLVQTKPDGTQVKINFSEGAPANMMIRIGLRPEMIKPGTKITAIGSPRKDDPNVYFLKSIILADGTTYSAMGGPSRKASENAATGDAKKAE